MEKEQKEKYPKFQVPCWGNISFLKYKIKETLMSPRLSFHTHTETTYGLTQWWPKLRQCIAKIQTNSIYFSIIERLPVQRTTCIIFSCIRYPQPSAERVGALSMEIKLHVIFALNVVLWTSLLQIFTDSKKVRIFLVKKLSKLIYLDVIWPRISKHHFQFLPNCLNFVFFHINLALKFKYSTIYWSRFSTMVSRTCSDARNDFTILSNCINNVKNF